MIADKYRGFNAISQKKNTKTKRKKYLLIYLKSLNLIQKEKIVEKNLNIFEKIIIKEN